MDISDTRKCNLFNLESVAKYLGAPLSEINSYYFELLEDREFLESVNLCISEVRNKYGFSKGIFGMSSISSIDWFAFERVLIYVLIRYFKPNRILETGVYYGGNSAFALLAIYKNNCGSCTSIDFPDSEIRKIGASEVRHSLVGDSELYDSSLNPGFMIPKYLLKSWEIIYGDSLQVIPKLTDTFDFYIHDSDHSMPFLSKELNAAFEKLSDKALLLVDDIDWSNAFFHFCVTRRLFPLMLTDNGKDNLRVRTGLVALVHPNNRSDIFT